MPTDKLSDAISSHVACVLKEEREKRDLSLKMLAKKSGISRQTISSLRELWSSLSCACLAVFAKRNEMECSKPGESGQRARVLNSADI